jgi:predicted GNAT family acetyltransferase
MSSPGVAATSVTVMASQAQVEVRDNPAEHRFEARVDGRLAGFTAYELTDGGIMILHTEVDDAFEGQGVGSSMTRQVLDMVRADDELEVTVLCPFVNAWLRRHPDYQDLTRR